MQLLFCMRRQGGWGWKTRSLTHIVATGPWNQSLVRSGSGAAWCNRRLPPNGASSSSWDMPCRWWESVKSPLRSAPGSCPPFVWHNLGWKKKRCCRHQLSLGMQRTLWHAPSTEGTASPPARRGLFLHWVQRVTWRLKEKRDKTQRWSWAADGTWFQNLCILIWFFLYFLGNCFPISFPHAYFFFGTTDFAEHCKIEIRYLGNACVCCNLTLPAAQSADPSPDHQVFQMLHDCLPLISFARKAGL